MFFTPSIENVPFYRKLELVQVFVWHLFYLFRLVFLAHSVQSDYKQELRSKAQQMDEVINRNQEWKGVNSLSSILNARYFNFILVYHPYCSLLLISLCILSLRNKIMSNCGMAKKWLAPLIFVQESVFVSVLSIPIRVIRLNSGYFWALCR